MPPPEHCSRSLHLVPHHYIILEGCKFKLEWEKRIAPQRLGEKKKPRLSNQYQFNLYLVNGNLHTLSCSQFTIGAGGISQVLAAVCCGKLLKETCENDLLGTVGSISLDCNDKDDKIEISLDQTKRCECECHEMYSGSDSESDQGIISPPFRITLGSTILY